LNQNPYEAPTADVTKNSEIDVPKKILQKIKNGWIAAIISGVMTLGVMLLVINTGEINNLVDIWTSVDVILIFSLAFGIYKKSRFAATAMFLYFLLSKIWMIVETGRPSGLLMGIIFLYFYFQAMVGTYQYHKIMKNY
jgi:hypothetical protein